MFWKKKTAFQEIAERWDRSVKTKISKDVQDKANALKDGMKIIATNASMIDYRKAIKLSENGAISFENMLRGAYLIGFDYGMKYSTDLNSLTKLNNFPPEVEEPIDEITQPCVDVTIKLVELSHVPGRIVLLKEDKEAVKKGLVGGIFIVAAEYFFEGVKMAAETQEKESEAGQSLPR